MLSATKGAVARGLCRCNARATNSLPDPDWPLINTVMELCERRPMASVINLDSDLYSSTMCALNYSKSVMDKDTILIFDEFIINENWEQDDFKALNDFCSKYRLDYEVVSVSFFSKQVALKLIGI